MCFFPYLAFRSGGEGGRSPLGSVHNVLMRFLAHSCCKNGGFQNLFFYMATTQNDHPNYACCV